MPSASVSVEGEVTGAVLKHGPALHSKVNSKGAETPLWFVANWQPAASGPEKHYSYAFQWFAMAVGLTVLFVVVNSSRRSSA